MKRLHVFALFIAFALVLALPSCRKSEARRDDALPFHATYTFVEVRNVELRGESEGYDAAQLSLLFAKGYVVYVADGEGEKAMYDFVECTDGVMTLVHYVGSGSFIEQEGKTVFARCVSERLTLGTYAGGEMKLTRPLFERGRVEGDKMILSLLEPSGDVAYAYEVVFVKD